MAGGLAFFVLMMWTPFITKHMKQSDSTYEELETDDPVALIERIYRQENLMEHYYQYRSRLTEEGKLPQKPKTITNLVDTVTDVLSSEALKSAVASVMIQVLESSQLQKALQKLLKNLWDDLINDPETTAQVVHLLQNAIQNQVIQKAVKELVMQIVDDPEVYEELTRLLVRLGQDKKVLEATQTLLTESAHNTLNDPEVLDHSMEFATDVVGDDIIQRTSGEALRNTVSYAVRPGLATFLSVLGAMLVIFGLSTLANAGASERDTAILEKAATTVVKNIKTGTLEGIGTLLSLPFKLASSCWSLVYGLINHSLSRLGRAGNTIFHHTTVFAETILTRFLSSLGHGTKSVISSMLNSTFQLISKTWNAMTRSLENNSTAAILSVKNMFIIISTWCGASFQNICNSVVTSKNVSTQTLLWAKEEMLNKLANLCDTFIRLFTKDGNGDGSKHAL
eukprot:CAMPEP_0178929196 /NCGR_PEP_ID=MMETSP0786-20121207/20418_1 /TAXON_ID=186022 /ORGANISM="Thalassionema frauenfeldii, Strain CCMP 1798" /LENGTH=451 /DNA_ID=CAMNT_0020605331 /DNA_START=328 /DNA_END=1683 /DNA_ORIENTATION=-